MGTINGISWLESDIKHKIGTVLWALAGVLYLIVGIKWLALVDDAGLDNMKAGFLVFLAYFVFYEGIAAGTIVKSSNLCAAIAKTWGVLAIVTAATYLIMFLAALIESKMGPVDIMDTLSLLTKADGASSFVVLLALALVFTIISAFTISVTDAPKSRLAALIFCVLTGMVGGHLIYAKRTKAAVVRIVLTVTLVLSGVSAILALVDLIKIALGKFKDIDGNALVSWT